MCEPIEKGKCVTTKEEYINAAVSQIENDSDKQEAALELAAHIDDRIEYYKEIGFDEAQAAQKAVEQMGDPDAVAVPLSRLHPKGRVWTAVLAVLSLFLVLAAFRFYKIWTLADGEMGFGILEFLLLFCFIGLSLFGKKRRNRFLCAVPMLLFPLTYAFCVSIAIDVSSIISSALICSPIVLSFFCLITGDLACLETFSMMGGITVAPWLTYATCAFYIFIFIVLISAFVSTCKLSKLNYSLTDKRASRIISVLQKSILLFSALVVLISLCCRRPASITAALGYEPEHFDTVVVLQSDKPCSVKEVDQENILIIEADWDFDDYIRLWDFQDKDMETMADMDCEFITVPCGRKLEYKFKKYTIFPKITKPYVYIGFVDSGIETVDLDTVSDFVIPTQEDWQETKSVGTERAAVDQYNVVEVVINAS